jgi:hypothetical protein
VPDPSNAGDSGDEIVSGDPDASQTSSIVDRDENLSVPPDAGESANDIMSGDPGAFQASPIVDSDENVPDHPDAGDSRNEMLSCDPDASQTSSSVDSQVCARPPGHWRGRSASQAPACSLTSVQGEKRFC